MSWHTDGDFLFRGGQYHTSNIKLPQQPDNNKGKKKCMNQSSCHKYLQVDKSIMFKRLNTIHSLIHIAIWRSKYWGGGERTGAAGVVVEVAVDELVALNTSVEARAQARLAELAGLLVAGLTQVYLPIVGLLLSLLWHDVGGLEERCLQEVCGSLLSVCPLSENFALYSVLFLKVWACCCRDGCGQVWVAFETATWALNVSNNSS